MRSTDRTPRQIRNFWRRVNKTEGCWLWTGAPANVGYGAVYFEGRDQSTHRVSWQLAYGPIPDGLCVLHKCDIRLCVNPEHLFLGTKKDNTQDMMQKGRNRSNPPRGERQHAAKLTEESVRSALARVAGGESQRSVARSLGVTEANVSAIIRGKSWRHVERLS